jgi:CheY-like chemotaxis protein
MTAKRVLNVGQCAADNWNISRTLEREFGVEVVPVSTATEALTMLRQESFALLLVNRILDWDGSSGLDLIRKVKVDDKLAAVPIMLVSNYADAQQQAEKAGAAPGFGKAGLGAPEMLERLRPFLSDGPAKHPNS